MLALSGGCQSRKPGDHFTIVRIFVSVVLGMDAIRGLVEFLRMIAAVVKLPSSPLLNGEPSCAVPESYNSILRSEFILIRPIHFL